VDRRSLLKGLTGLAAMLVIPVTLPQPRMHSLTILIPDGDQGYIVFGGVPDERYARFNITKGRSSV
jgi:hypothetical protein